MRHLAGPCVLLILVLLLAAPVAHAEVHAVTDARALGAALLTPGGLTLRGGPYLNELSATGLVDPDGGILLSTGRASDANQPAAVTVNHNLGRPGLTFLEGVAGADADTGRDAVMLELVLQAGAHVTGAAFDFVFATDEPAGSRAPTAFNDAFAVRLFRPPASMHGPNIALHEDAPITVNTVPLVHGSRDAFDRSTGLHTARFALTPGEEFSLIFMLSDIGAGAGDSAVYLANLRAVPEPSPAALMALGLVATVLWRARIATRRPRRPRVSNTPAPLTLGTGLVPNPLTHGGLGSRCAASAAFIALLAVLPALSTAQAQSSTALSELPVLSEEEGLLALEQDLSLKVGKHLQLVDYPEEALRWRWTGTALIEVVIGGNGLVKQVALSRTSGFRVLDEQALAVVRRVPKVFVPVGLRMRDRTLTVPVGFYLQHL